MKKLLLLIPLCGVLILSCSSPKSKYGQAISDHVQKDDGMFIDMSFRIKKIEELPPLTIADSVEILKGRWTQLHRQNVAKGANDFGLMNAILKGETTGIAEVDSLLSKQPPEPKKYEGRKYSEPLLKRVKCRFSYIPPFFSKTVEQTGIFYITLDGKKVIRSEDAKE